MIVYPDARIDPGNAFRLVVKVAKFMADDEYGLVDMAEQQHDLWLDRNCKYSLAQFHDELATKIIWGPSQTLALWVLDQDTGSEWKIRRDEHFDQMIRDRWNERLAVIAVDVVTKDGYTENASSGASKGRCVSGVTSERNGGQSADDAEGYGDTYSSPEEAGAITNAEREQKRPKPRLGEKKARKILLLKNQQQLQGPEQLLQEKQQKRQGKKQCKLSSRLQQQGKQQKQQQGKKEKLQDLQLQHHKVLRRNM